MISCWVLYDRCDIGRNRFFADSLVSRCRGLGMDARLVMSDDLPRDPPDAVINRGRDWELTRRLEDAGVTVSNPSEVTRVCTDKLETHRLALSLGIDVMPVSLPGEELPPGPPWVVKSRIGHGGSEVRLALSPGEAEAACSEMAGRLPIVQSMADPGRDMRAYVLGDEILACVMRTSSSDFRANHSLGGSAEPCGTPDGVAESVGRICRELRPDLIGVDFVFLDGKPVLNEIEDPVGTRMLYELTCLDPAGLLAERVYSKISL